MKKSIFAIFRASFFGVLTVEELQDLKTKFVRVGLNEVGLALAISYNKNAIGLAVDYSSRTLLLCVRIRLHIGIAHPLSATAVRPRSDADSLIHTRTLSSRLACFLCLFFSLFSCFSFAVALARSLSTSPSLFLSISLSPSLSFSIAPPEIGKRLLNGFKLNSSRGFSAQMRRAAAYFACVSVWHWWYVRIRARVRSLYLALTYSSRPWSGLVCVAGNSLSETCCTLQNHLCL